jgi:hypothetical protein
MTEEDPLSTESIGIHLLKLIVLVAGGCAIEGIKRAWEPPLITNAMLGVGEFTMFVYMIGALGQAFHWSWNQWSRGKPVVSQSGERLFRQFWPKRIEARTLLRPPKFFLRLLIYVIPFLVILFIADTQHCGPGQWKEESVRLSDRKISDPRLSNPDSDVLRNIRLEEESPLSVALAAFNSVSVRLLEGAVILFVVALLGATLVVVWNRRKASRMQN